MRSCATVRRSGGMPSGRAPASCGDAVGPGARGIDQHRGANFARRARSCSRQPPPVALGRVEPCARAQLAPRRAGRREVVLVEPGDVDVGAGRLPRPPPVQPARSARQPLEPAPRGRAARSCTPLPAKRSTKASTAGASASRADVERAARAEEAVRRAGTAPRRASAARPRARRSIPPRTPPSARWRDSPARPRPRAAAPLRVRGEFGGEAGPGHPGADDGDVVTLAHRGGCRAVEEIVDRRQRPVAHRIGLAQDLVARLGAEERPVRRAAGARGARAIAR